MLIPPDDARPLQINVHDEADWQKIYKNPSIRVKCLVETCDTLLTPKQMRRCGLRFLAIRYGMRDSQRRRWRALLLTF